MMAPSYPLRSCPLCDALTSGGRPCARCARDFRTGLTFPAGVEAPPGPPTGRQPGGGATPPGSPEAAQMPLRAQLLPDPDPRTQKRG